MVGFFNSLVVKENKQLPDVRGTDLSSQFYKIAFEAMDGA